MLSERAEMLTLSSSASYMTSGTVRPSTASLGSSFPIKGAIPHIDHAVQEVQRLLSARHKYGAYIANNSQ
jgi:hypothetical protein